MIFQTFRWSFAITAAGLLAAVVLGGPTALATVAILAVLEISLSFDNAVVNAKVLERMSEFWQKIFLTIGIAVAVFGMRLLFPLVIVGITAKLNPLQALDLAMNDGAAYAAKLDEAHPMIAAFGGIFLLLLFLDFIFEERAVKWLGWLERPLAKIGRLDHLSVVVASIALAVVGGIFADDPSPVMIAGVLGIVTYLLVNGLGELFVAQGAEMAAGSSDDDPEESGEPERTGPNKAVLATGKAAFFLFLYLEVLDASFSFDGVIGAFAISSNLFIIAAGLGIGALYIRSLTVYLVKKGSLAEYIYLEHGAHWAIGALAVTMLVGVSREVPEVVSGLTGAILIIASMLSSIIRNRRARLPAGGAAGKKEFEFSRV
ncbi:DUF475 domain-containing protein [Actinomadura scrupuli]|uniref:DUF475 domain-containing protein n=1 Tax=Actinomadura scrupuli TaxID=559629 RepID=UPI003D971F2E